MRGTGDAQRWAAISATPAKFTLGGGVYTLAAQATWGGGFVEVQQMGPDGATPLGLATPCKLTSNGVTAPAYLAPGQYVLTVMTATGISATLTRVPTE